MAGPFSGHLVDSFLSSQQYTQGPFGRPFSSSSLQIATQGAMSFAPQMHGTPSFSFEPSFIDLSEDTARKISTLQSKLNQKLGPEYISQRPGPGGGPKLTYAEGWKIINLANEVFGFNGWSSNIVNLSTDYIDLNEETKRYNVGVTAIVRVTLRDGVYHEDIGYGLLENSKSKGAALDKCKKEAVTDAVKRTLRNFGNLLGNCLYDKSYTQEVIKIKVPPPRFDKSELYRRPEFAEPKPDPGASLNMSGATLASTSAPSACPSIKTEPPTFTHPAAASTPARVGPTALPPHMRNVSGPPPAATSTPNARPALAQQQQQQHQQQQNQQNRRPQTNAHQERKVTFAAPSAPALTPPSARAPPPQSRAPAASTSTSAPAPVPVASTSAPAPAPAPAPPAPAVAPAAPKSVPAPAPAPKQAEVWLPDDEDSFHFGSDDDAMFAAVDLEAIGRPIDFEEGTPDAASKLSPSLPPQQQQQQQRASQAQQRQRPPHPAPYQSRAPQPQPQPQPQLRPQRTCAPASKPQQPSSSKVYANQNVPPPKHGGAAPMSSTPASAKPPTPPGSFNFPPGVNLQNAKLGVPPSTASRAVPSSSSSGIGLKRSADVMQGQSAGPVRRPAQGMGLSTGSGSGWSVQQGTGAKREPFTALELGEGGSVKRIRR